jgi:hypothetical protein
MAMADTEPAQVTHEPEPELDLEVAAERRLVHQVVIGGLVGVPIGIVVCIGIVLVAVRVAGVPEGGPELMAVFVGILFGVFFGALSGFVRNTAALDELDRHLPPRVAPKPSA